MILESNLVIRDGVGMGSCTWTPLYSLYLLSYPHPTAFHRDLAIES